MVVFLQRSGKQGNRIQALTFLLSPRKTVPQTRVTGLFDLRARRAAADAGCKTFPWKHPQGVAENMLSPSPKKQVDIC